jgi:hypothetical protein
MHERALETREPSCVHRAAKSFFIPAVHSPPGAIGHVAAPELLSQKGRALSRGTYGSTRAPLSEKGRAQSHGICGNAGDHLSKEARSGAVGDVTAPELTSTMRRGP